MKALFNFKRSALSVVLITSLSLSACGGETATVPSASAVTPSVVASSPAAGAAPASMPAVAGTPVKMASGLQYIDVKVGEGIEAKAKQNITVNYTGYLSSNGKKFDSSIGKQPFSFVLGSGQVIKGWDEGVVGMKVGGKRRLIIPAELAYGSRGAGGGAIPPNAELTFDVDFLDAKDSGVPAVDGTPVKTASGLAYIDSKVGNGAEAKAGQTVDVHYTGYLTDGKKFDSSVDRGSPFSFPLGAGNVIKGWDEGVAGMKVGGKRRLIIPANLGYGAAGSPPAIPGGAELIFDVELLAIK